MNKGQSAIKKIKAHPKRIAMYVIYDKDGILDGFRKYYLQELRKVVNCIVAVVSGNLTDESTAELQELCNDVYFRENKGLLAGSWIDGIAHIGWEILDQYDELLMLNDSFFGPFYPIEELMDAMEKSKADFYGATKNFEERNYTNFAGRPLKHGYFRGSISYFYVIKSNLLHSKEFKEYWSELPEIKEDWDTYFYAEIDFYDYVRDNGFTVDAFQGDSLKGYFFDNLTHNIRQLIEKDRIPFARIRPFCTDIKEQSLQVHYGKDPRLALEYIDKHTDYDVNYIWDYILRAKNLTDIWNQLQLEYVVSKYAIEKPYTYDKTIAVILHIYYDDLVEHIADYCQNFPKNTRFFITTINKSTKEKIDRVFKMRGMSFICKRRPNVGVAMSTLWVTYADVVIDGKYDYVCYFHDKKSPYTQYQVHGEQFATRCYENLFGTPEVVKNIINLFEENPRLGVLGAPLVYHGDYFTTAMRGWAGNYENTVALAEELGLKVNIDLSKTPVAPYGDMLWFRAKALKKAIGHRYNYKDFNIQYHMDFTKLHAMERIYSFAAQDSGYYYADVINTDDARSDLINYQYMLYKLCEIMLKNGHYPYAFVVAEDIQRQYKNLFLGPIKHLEEYRANILSVQLVGLDVKVLVRNSSCIKWSRDQIRLALFSNGEGTNIRGYLPENGLAPDEEAMISISLDGNEDLLSTQLEIQMVHEGLCFFGRKKRIGEYSLQRYDAEFVGCKAPDQVQIGESYQISVTMRNTGADTWREEDQIRLCIRRDGMDHGYRIKLNNGCEVAPGCEYQFLFDNFLLEDERSTILEFQMVKEGVGFFGESDTAFIVSKN